MVILARNCPRLKRLNLNRCDLVSDLTLKELGKYCLQLEIINLSRPLLIQRLRLSDESVRLLMKKRPLVEVRLRNCEYLSDQTVTEMSQTGQNLRALDLR
jgi:hypothetical protein